MKRSAGLPLTAVLVLLLAALGPAALAAPGGADDPNDTAGPLDIRRVSHDNDDSTVTYRFETYERFGLSDFFLARWDFDFNGDGIPADACIIVKQLGSTTTLRGGFFAECGPETWATADARIVGGNTMQITFPILDLVEGGRLAPGSDYSYRVTTVDSNGLEDTAPERALAVHRGVPKVNPRPGTADTQMGNPGEGQAATGRGQRTAAEAAQGAPVPDADDTADGPLASIPIIGNLCSGPLCVLLGVGAPIVLVALVWVGYLVYRARRRTKDLADEPDTEMTDLTPEAEPDIRSYPGHAGFAPPSETADSVRSVPGLGIDVGRQETDHGSQD